MRLPRASKSAPATSTGKQLQDLAQRTLLTTPRTTEGSSKRMRRPQAIISANLAAHYQRIPPAFSTPATCSTKAVNTSSSSPKRHCTSPKSSARLKNEKIIGHCKIVICTVTYMVKRDETRSTSF